MPCSSGGAGAHAAAASQFTADQLRYFIDVRTPDGCDDCTRAARMRLAKLESRERAEHVATCTAIPCETCRVHAVHGGPDPCWCGHGAK